MLARTLRLFIVQSLLFAAGAAALHADPVVYAQPYSVGAYYTWASCTSPTGTIATGYDDFTLTTAANVTAVQWHGNYVANTDRSGQPVTNNPVAPGTTAFTVSFLADNGGSPGAVLSTSTVAMADCQPQSLGTVGFQYQEGGTIYQIPFYAYRAVLPTPFAATAGQKYWVSIVGKTNTDATLWSWYSNGDATDGESVQDFGGRITRPFNRNFTLEGTSAAPVTNPDVNVAVTTKAANANTGLPGVFTLTLPAPAATKLNVKYTLGGTAVNGTDYKTLKLRAKFQPGQSSVDVQVVPTLPPVGVPYDAFKKTVLLTLQPGNGYTVGTTKPAKVKITRTAGIILP